MEILDYCTKNILFSIILFFFIILGDGQITLEEFTFMAPKVINECGDIPADVV
jgi:hypothetical protein